MSGGISMLQIGSYVDGKYKVLNKIGQGGMSVVYLALNEKANKTWAIKEVRKDGQQDFTTVKQGLIVETNILKELNHKYLPSIIDVIDDGDSFLIVMDYIQGKSLDKILKGSMEKEGLPIALDDVIDWGKQLCEVFYYLHTRPNPIIYRDMKPGNVMLKPDGEISLIDFGTARTFKQGNREDTTCLGTPGYASPEQYGGNGQSTPRSDIYCLGATLHHLITGRNPSPTPFNFPKITQCRPSLVDEIPREDMNKLLGLEMIIDRCTQYEPENRYESCLEMLYDLEHIEELSLPYRKKLRNKLLGFGVSAAVAVLCGGISLGCMLMENKTEQSGYDYYVDQAEKSDGTAKVNYAKKAVAIDPGKEEAYLVYLDALRNDEDGFSGQDSQDFKALLQQMAGRQTYEEVLEDNLDGYTELAYELGMAYYFPGGAGKPAGDKELAKKWFGIVAQAVLSDEQLKAFSLDSTEKLSADKIQEYDIDTNLVETFLSICSYYGKVGQEDTVTGEIKYSYSDFWVELNGLVGGLPETISTESRERLTQLRLLNDVSYQLYENAKQFVSDAGVDKATFQGALAAIETRVSGADTGSNQTAQRIRDNTMTTVDNTKKLVESLYAQNSDAVKSGGDQ